MYYKNLILLQRVIINLIKNNMHWVKKEISKGEWDNYYSKNSSYCTLATGKTYTIGFLVNEIPDECEECDLYELRKIDLYRRNANIAPFPLVIEKKEEQPTFTDLEKRKEILIELAKLKEGLRNVLSQ
jgi:hypothetical protein